MDIAFFNGYEWTLQKEVYIDYLHVCQLMAGDKGFCSQDTMTEVENIVDYFFRKYFSQRKKEEIFLSPIFEWFQQGRGLTPLPISRPLCEMSQGQCITTS